MAWSRNDDGDAEEEEKAIVAGWGQSAQGDGNKEKKNYLTTLECGIFFSTDFVFLAK